jgi:hypothetical protein
MAFLANPVHKGFLESSEHLKSSDLLKEIATGNP